MLPSSFQASCRRAARLELPRRALEIAALLLQPWESCSSHWSPGPGRGRISFSCPGDCRLYVLICITCSHPPGRS